MRISFLSSGKKFIVGLFVLLLLPGLAACAGEGVVPLPTPIIPASVADYTATAPDTRPPTPVITPRPVDGTAVSLPTPLPPLAQPAQTWRVGVSPAAPPELQAHIQQMIQANPAGFTWVGNGEADVVIGLEGTRPFFSTIYVPAAPFATLTDAISQAALLAAWQSGAGDPLVLTDETAAALTAVWGAPHTGVQIVPAAELLAEVWQQRPSLTILPFDQLQPELKALRLDGASPLDRDFDPAGYPLTVSFAAGGLETAVSDFVAAWNGPASNYEPAKLTRVALTGVTALVRATAYNMEQKGILWPAEDVGPVLQMADIAHVSNEVSFAPDCPYPNPIGGTTFCSRDSYFALLQHLGVDVVELTGNHLNDWGRANLLRTIDMYEAAGMAVYGGGKDGAAAAEPALFSHNGNRIAFVGCNSFGPTYAWATATEAGSRPCDEGMTAQVRQLADDGYLVIVTLQYTEDYQYTPSPQQKADFRAWADAGATAVSGSQGHHAQGFDFYKGSFIHHGPGNLFFDQMDMLGTRQTFVDTYVIYDGRLLNVELWTGLIENYAKPRLMTAEERAQALTAVFQASGW
ncbi:MAG: CapA family protein [Chloroflexi bacterium]|nr:CapA family protein [Chloroflexota bacterium]